MYHYTVILQYYYFANIMLLRLPIEDEGSGNNL